MPEAEKTEEVVDAGERDIFKDHVATYVRHSEHLETLEWKKPGSSTYAIWYVRQYGTLMVWGDCYEATYQWSYQKGLDLRWIAGCNEGYFIGKCRASPDGRDPRRFDSRTLEEELRSYFAHGCHFDKPLCSNGECEDCDERRKEAKLFEENMGWRYTESEFEWNRWLYDNADDVFGAEWWETLPQGKKLGPCIPLHLKGLKRAMQQLEATFGGKDEEADRADTS